MAEKHPKGKEKQRMHQTRSETTMKLPIKRKGTKYVARALSHVGESVPVLIAIRDMLNLGRTAKEVNEMVKAKLLKLNGKIVEDYHESIRLFNILEAGKNYTLTILPSGKFALEETKNSNERLCKVTDKRLVGDGKIQFNLHDGSNVLTKEKIAVGDSVYLDFSGKIKKHVKLEKGADVFVLSGKYVGLNGKIESIEGKSIKVKFKDNGSEASLYAGLLIAK